jgi:hypothetical protein
MAGARHPPITQARWRCADTQFLDGRGQKQIKRCDGGISLEAIAVSVDSSMFCASGRRRTDCLAQPSLYLSVARFRFQSSPLTVRTAVNPRCLDALLYSFACKNRSGGKQGSEDEYRVFILEAVPSLPRSPACARELNARIASKMSKPQPLPANL